MVVRDEVLKVEQVGNEYKIYQGTGYCTLLLICTKDDLFHCLLVCYISELFYDGRMTEVGTYGFNIVYNNKGIRRLVKERYYDKVTQDIFTRNYNRLKDNLCETKEEKIRKQAEKTSKKD